MLRAHRFPSSAKETFILHQVVETDELVLNMNVISSQLVKYLGLVSPRASEPSSECLASSAIYFLLSQGVLSCKNRNLFKLT